MDERNLLLDIQPKYGGACGWDWGMAKGLTVIHTSPASRLHTRSVWTLFLLWCQWLEDASLCLMLFFKELHWPAAVALFHTLCSINLQNGKWTAKKPVTAEARHSKKQQEACRIMRKKAAIRTKAAGLELLDFVLKDRDVVHRGLCLKTMNGRWWNAVRAPQWRFFPSWLSFSSGRCLTLGRCSKAQVWCWNDYTGSIYSPEWQNEDGAGLNRLKVAFITNRQTCTEAGRWTFTHRKTLNQQVRHQ